MRSLRIEIEWIRACWTGGGLFRIEIERIMGVGQAVIRPLRVRSDKGGGFGEVLFRIDIERIRKT